MHLFREMPAERIKILSRLINEKEEALRNAPSGLVNISKKNNRVQYYFKELPRSLKRIYLKENQGKLIEALCQKDYDEKVLQAMQNELKQLTKLEKNYPAKSYEEVYENLHVDRKKWVNPIILPDEEYRRKWEQVEYERKEFREDAPEYYADNGERVRSKTEILIANLLKKHNIPYRYECPLKLKGGWVNVDT